MSDSSPIRAMAKNDFDSVLRNYKAAKHKSKEAAADCGDILKKAVNDKGLHKASFLTIVKLDAMDDVTRAEWLFHFDTARERLGWDSSDLLPDRQRTQKEDAAAKTANIADITSERERKVAEDDKRDFRPSNLQNDDPGRTLN